MAARPPRPRLKSPTGVAVDDAGNLYIGDCWRRTGSARWTPRGSITTIAGTGERGERGFEGDGGPAVAGSAKLPPIDVALDGAGSLYIADTGNNRIRVVRTQILC